MDPSTHLFGVPVAPCCSGGGGGDLLPLWLAPIVLFAGHIVLREFKNRKGRPGQERLKNLALVVAAAAAAVFALKPHRDPPKPLPAAARKPFPPPSPRRGLAWWIWVRTSAFPAK